MITVNAIMVTDNCIQFIHTIHFPTSVLLGNANLDCDMQQICCHSLVMNLLGKMRL